MSFWTPVYTARMYGPLAIPGVIAVRKIANMTSLVDLTFWLLSSLPFLSTAVALHLLLYRCLLVVELFSLVSSVDSAAQHCCYVEQVGPMTKSLQNFLDSVASGTA